MEATRQVCIWRLVEGAALASSCKNWEAKLRAAAMPEEAQVGHGA